MGLHDYTVYSIMKRNARLYGARVAWSCAKENVTHREYLDRSDRLCRGLMDAGLVKGDRLGVIGENTLEFAYLYGAAAKIGAIVVPINWRLHLEEIEYILRDIRPAMIFASPTFHETIAALRTKFEFVAHWYSLGREHKAFAPFNLLFRNDGCCPEVDVAMDDPYVIIHTAAVDGRPRGATLTHGGLVMSSLQTIAALGLTAEDRSLVVLPFFHLSGMILSLNVMQAGGRNILVPRFDSGSALEIIQNERVTIFGELPPILAGILDKTAETGGDISSLKTVVGLSHPQTIDSFERLTGGTFWSIYGQSETSGFVTLAPYRDCPGSAGRPGQFCEVEIVDERGRIVETETPGEIVLRGPLVFKGYWNLKNETAYTFRNNWHHTGDMGRFDSNGYLWFQGRKPEKDLIKPGGENVYPSEVEAVILQHPSIKEVAVIGVADQQWGEAVKAVCVPLHGQAVSESEIIEFVASRIARYKKPKFVTFVPHLPKTEEGIIDRAAVISKHCNKIGD